MDTFDKAWDLLMELEGGGVLHEVRGDPGGRTVWGIAENRHPDMFEDGPPNEAEAKEFYIREFWKPLLLHRVDSPVMAVEIFEFAVNAGFRPAVLAAQRAVNGVRDLVDAPRIEEDGVTGMQTVRALNQIHSGMGAVGVMAWEGEANLNQLRHYRSLPRHLVDRFFVGWTRRVAD